MSTDSPTITILPSQKTFTVPRGSILLNGLWNNGINIPSACGGRGICGLCKLKVTGVTTPPTAAEIKKIPPPELEQRFRLTCQIRVETDLTLEIPEDLIARSYTGTVIFKKQLTYDIVHLAIALPQTESMPFTSGQYVQITTRAYDGKEPTVRAYSIASTPSRANIVELMIRKVPGGICTTWVFDHLSEGDCVDLSGPYGSFRLSKTTLPILFIGGGSGMAPFWSMLNTMREKKINRRVQFFFGAVTQRDLFLIDEISALQKELVSFAFVPALSGEPADSDWHGERGLITEVVARTVPDTSGHEAYLCGSPGMIDACCAMLTKGGLLPERIFYDKFA